jgi:hypothetical protein
MNFYLAIVERHYAPLMLPLISDDFGSNNTTNTSTHRSIVLEGEGIQIFFAGQEIGNNNTSGVVNNAQVLVNREHLTKSKQK